MAARKLAVNVIHGGVAYGPDYPHNKVTPERASFWRTGTCGRTIRTRTRKALAPDRIGSQMARTPLPRLLPNPTKAVQGGRKWRAGRPQGQARVGTKVARDQ
jgi:hypothetical protein